MKTELARGRAWKSMMPKKKEISSKMPSVVEELAQIIEKGLERFPEDERNARLDRIHLILAGAGKPRRGTSSKRRQTPASPRSTRRRAKRS
jgi:hypothetical protein